MSSVYWQDRIAEALDKISQKNIKEIDAQMRKYYNKSVKQVIKEFEDTYEKVLKVKESGREPTPADLYNIDRYWNMQNEMKQVLQKLGDKEVELFTKEFEKEFLDIYKSIALPSGSAYSSISEASVRQFINSIWCEDGQNWSNRIWKNNQLLAQTLNDTLLDCIISGKPTRELKILLQERFKTTYYCAKRIVNTEIAHIQTEAARQRYKDYGIKQVQFWAAPDERTCPECGVKHEKIFPIDEIGLVPLHPNCRCCIIPIVGQNKEN